eukprot:scaffold858_cov123-Cylindrotheca_fusiformis.AAC.47
MEDKTPNESASDIEPSENNQEPSRKKRLANRGQQELTAKRVVRYSREVSTAPSSCLRTTPSSSLEQQESSEGSDAGLTPTRKPRPSARTREGKKAMGRAADDGAGFRAHRVGRGQEQSDQEAKNRAGAFRVFADNDMETLDYDTPKVGGETVVEAVVAPDLHEEVEAALQSVREAAEKEAEILRQRVVELEQANGNNGDRISPNSHMLSTEGIVVAVAEQGGPDDDCSKEDDGSVSKRRTIRNCGLVALVLAIAGGAAAGVLLGGASSGASNTKSAREIMLEEVLSDHVPLQTDAFSWLAETDTWEPDEDVMNPDALWAERYAMATLYFAAGGNGWTKNDSWLSEDGVCEWFMRDWDLPHCNRDNEMTRLELWQDNLSGSIPSELGILTQLTYLSLRDNNLGGTIPSELGLLTNLVYLNFHVNSLSGIIPNEYGSLSGLTTLHMHDNVLTGTLPTELGTMVGMTDLELCTFPRKMESNIADFLNRFPHHFFLCPHLPFVLDNNGLTGTVPTELSNMSALEFLFLYVNRLTGTIPPLPSTLSLCLLAKSDSTDYVERNCFEGNTTVVAESLGCDLTKNCEQRTSFSFKHVRTFHATSMVYETWQQVFYIRDIFVQMPCDERVPTVRIVMSRIGAGSCDWQPEAL